MTGRTTTWADGAPCWLHLSVPDLERACAFYESVIGWTFADTGPDISGYRVWCQVGGRFVAALGLMQSAAQHVAWLVYLASHDAQRTAELIVANRGEIAVSSRDVPRVGRIVVAADITGGAFGVFQATERIGTEVLDEPGAFVWTDARLRDVPEGRRFYGAVFAYSYRPIPQVPIGEYAIFGPDDRPWGGMGGLMGAPSGVPSHWLPYFSVANVDAAVARAGLSGGGMRRSPEDTPFGRIAVLADPFGAPFGLVGAA